MGDEAVGGKEWSVMVVLVKYVVDMDQIMKRWVGRDLDLFLIHSFNSGLLAKQNHCWASLCEYARASVLDRPVAHKHFSDALEVSHTKAKL